MASPRPMSRWREACSRPMPRSSSQQRVSELQESRDASVEASASELRRIERDLHDGAQQRLVSLAMNLGIAKERLEAADDERAAELVGRAHDEAKQAIAELRDLVRGIHPAVLTDRARRGGVGAHRALPRAGRAAQRPAPASAARCRGAAYFVVAEALTNVAKHSGARAQRLTLRDGGRRSPAGRGARRRTRRCHRRGTAAGCAGLRDRVAGVEGRLRIASPPGGPTTIVSVELPCGS
jgi:signal transduction histidine kinase